jgi:hypothetical protein
MINRKLFITYSKILVYTSFKYFFYGSKLFLFNRLEILNFRGRIDTGFLHNKSGNWYT